MHFGDNVTEVFLLSGYSMDKENAGQNGTKERRYLYGGCKYNKK